eukprot:m51a1_g12471 hypothetical protein (158) ;mRNA; f:2328-2958
MPSSARVRVAVQQVCSADLDNGEGTAACHIGRGVVVYAVFLSGADPSHISTAVNEILNAQICRGSGEGKASVLDVGGDVLVVPQASMAGKLKGSAVQYHSLAPKGAAQELYDLFVRLACEAVGQRSAGAKVLHGAYGAIQRLRVDATDGPFTHVFEF